MTDDFSMVCFGLWWNTGETEKKKAWFGRCFFFPFFFFFY